MTHKRRTASDELPRRCAPALVGKSMFVSIHYQ